MKIYGVMNIVKILIVSSAVSQLIASTECKFRYILRKISCETSNKTILDNVTCNYRTFNRNSYITFRGTMVRQIPQVKMDSITRWKNSDGYQPVLVMKAIAICEILKNIESASVIPYLKNVMNFVKKSFGHGNLLEGCNLFGEIYLYNATFANWTSLEMHPAGDYFLTWFFYDDIDAKIMNVSFFGRLLKF